ncbi:thiamine pyrophosphate-dependent enzyme [Alisedimentitalea sp. MJ-SS2]|uniref:thiamine pyrophosphate-dependent enzyme n=1 Tax=Aliisedimentitalea sp. MJ-SS2 TaxID=3049795 RepID=UPI002911C23F|nr:thiamine pyrophosphate-dependent enzyme [Alisedimentitalea sp. MJ-SS2]MDU8926165.1 thiamine pyrophosphate-dependent enzyme [Alisedimentitalea sp. MJ-SS2]
MDRADIVDEAFRRKVADGDLPGGKPASGPLAAHEAVEIFRAQCLSRNLDRRSRKMQAEGQGFYTIGSSGHEGMAAVAAALRADDMAFLHYRDGAFQTMRATQLPGMTPAWDMLLSFATSREDPMSGGRHKVLGSKALAIPPQTSTIASHLPKAVGAAYSVGLAKRHRPEHQVMADDGIVMCSFGDASSNHSTAQGAINTACWTAFQSVPMPLLFVCEDNGIGISTRTPKGWVAANYAEKPGLKYFHANGLDIYDTYRVAQEATDYVRERRKPAFLHLSLVRLYGHAGSDLQQAYLKKGIFEGWEADDPLLHSARLLIDGGVLSADDVLAIYHGCEDQCSRVAEEVITRPRLKTAEEVMASLIPPARECAPSNGPSAEAREATFGSDFKQLETPQPMSRLLNWALTDLMLEHGEIVMMGEDVGTKGGVYGVTQKLVDRFGADRMIDTLLDEQSILGLAIGMAHNGFVPIPEIQFLAYLHNAEDQLRGEAATLPFFSNGQFTNPMVLRIAGLGYQKGFGGHFHNDNSLAVLRDIPGVIIACPSRGDDGAMMMRECVRLAREENRVVVVVEPIALYPMRDLMDDKDGGWMRTYPSPDQRIGLGEVGVEGDGPLAILTYGNGRYLSTQAAADLTAEGIDTRIIDMRWLAPLPVDGIVGALKGAKKVLIVDECRSTGSQSEALMAMLQEQTILPHARIAAEDSFIATGPAYAATMPSRGSIVEAARNLWSAK